MTRIFSGVQPTGNLHLGNYLGAIRNWAALQQEFDDCIFCVVDQHAITLWQDPGALARATRETAAAVLAAGIDAAKCLLFNQSMVPAHAQLAWVFNCVARVGWLNRMTQFKSKAGQNRENASVGLFAYPTLMAADVLLYKATHVPVGEDQKQHLELTRDVAIKFNADFGKDVFPIAEPVILGGGARIMSLRDGTQKMSKSDPSDYSRISMTDDAETIARKLRKAKTDSAPLPCEADGLKGRPEARNLATIYAALRGETLERALREVGGKPFSEFKRMLTDLVVSLIGPMSEEMNRYLADPGQIDAILRDGAERANAAARPVIAEVYETVGFLNP